MQKNRPYWLLETRDLIAIVMVCAMVGLLFTLVLRPTAIPDNQMTNMLIGGFMTTGFAAVMQFYFGSSKGSVAKDDTINAIASTQAAGVEPVVKPVVSAGEAVKPIAAPFPVASKA